MRRIIVGLSALALVSPLMAQTSPNSGRWRFGEGANGELAAEISTELGRGFVVSLTFQCNEGGRYSHINYVAGEPNTEALAQYIDSFLGDESYIETYANGARTDRFRPTGFHRGQGDEVTDARLTSIRQAQFIVITGGLRPIALPATGASIALAQYIAACGVLRRPGG